ncbi:MAG: hypothetical protein ACKVTZ_19050 [Bacteroidia bacterium]
MNDYSQKIKPMLTYAELQNTLEENGYIVFFRTNQEDKFLMVCTSTKMENMNGFEFQCSQNCFAIWIKQEKIVVDYWIGQTPVEEPCENREEMLLFLKEKFPLPS